MHEFAVRGGPIEKPTSVGCFMVGGAVVGGVALHHGPGLWLMVCLAVHGLLRLLPREWVQRMDTRVVAALPWVPLAWGLLGTVVRLPASAELLFWIGFYSMAAAVMVSWGNRLARRAAWPMLTAANGGRERERSVAAFLAGDLEQAREIARQGLEGAVDLEEGRQLRAWSAYLEIAAGCPGRAAALAEAAIGPQVMAGEEWLAYCRALHAWALWEQGFVAEAEAEASFYYSNCANAGEIRDSLMELRLYLLSEPEPRWPRKSDREKNPMGDLLGPVPKDSFGWGLLSRRLARIRERDLAVEAAHKAEALAVTPYARARALLDHGCVLLGLGNPCGARARLREALALWPTLPAAMLALAAAEEALGEMETARILRNEARRRFPEHGAALVAGTTGLPA